MGENWECCCGVGEKEGARCACGAADGINGGAVGVNGGGTFGVNAAALELKEELFPLLLLLPLELLFVVLLLTLVLFLIGLKLITLGGATTFTAGGGAMVLYDGGGIVAMVGGGMVVRTAGGATGAVMPCGGGMLIFAICPAPDTPDGVGIAMGLGAVVVIVGGGEMMLIWGKACKFVAPGGAVMTFGG